MATVIAAHAMLNSKLECSVCYQVFTDPRILPCGHTFCLKCLQDIVKAAAGKSNNIPCPQCRAEFQASNQNLQNLPKNFIVAQLICSLPANSHCTNDSQHGPAQHVCLDCWDALCDTCSKYHTVTRFTKDHTVKLLSEVTTEDIQTHKTKQIVYCTVHPKQEVAFYCENKTCQRFVCGLCTGVKCKSHTCFELSDANDKFITEINKTLIPLQHLSTKFDSVIQNISFAITNLSANHDTVQHDIETLLSDAEVKLQSLFDKLLAAVRQCRATAMQTVHKSHSEQMDKLQTTLADKQKQSHNIKQHVISVEHHLTPSSSVFDKPKLIKDELPGIRNDTIQNETHNVSLYLNTDTSKWKTGVTAWLQTVSDALTTATTRLPQLVELLLDTPSVAIGGHVTSAKNKHNFVVKQLKNREYDVDVLSVSWDGQLLVGSCFDRQLHVYSAEGNHVTSFKLLDGHTLTDAVWTPRGNIVYTDNTNSNVVLLTQCGKLIARTTTSSPYRLSVSTDDVIYLADCRTGVNQSSDDGVTWCHVFKIAYGCECCQVVKVSSDNNAQVFWIVDRLTGLAGSRKWRLQVYTVDTRRVGTNIVTSHDVTLPSHVTVNLQYSKLTYDGQKYVFVTDFNNKAVHMWSVSDRQYVCQLVSSQQLVAGPLCVAVDSRRGHVMYVGQSERTVGVFDFT